MVRGLDSSTLDGRRRDPRGGPRNQRPAHAQPTRRTRRGTGRRPPLTRGAGPDRAGTVRYDLLTERIAVAVALAVRVPLRVAITGHPPGRPGHRTVARRPEPRTAQLRGDPDRTRYGHRRRRPAGPVRHVGALRDLAGAAGPQGPLREPRAA